MSWPRWLSDLQANLAIPEKDWNSMCCNPHSPWQANDTSLLAWNSDPGSDSQLSLSPQRLLHLLRAPNQPVEDSPEASRPANTNKHGTISVMYSGCVHTNGTYVTRRSLRRWVWATRPSSGLNSALSLLNRGVWTLETRENKRQVGCQHQLHAGAFHSLLSDRRDLSLSPTSNISRF